MDSKTAVAYGWGQKEADCQGAYGIFVGDGNISHLDHSGGFLGETPIKTY